MSNILEAMFCPQCKAEYRPGFTRCSECGVVLVFRLPDEEPEFDTTMELVVIRHYANAFEIDIARGVLEAAGIRSMIRGGNYGARGMGTSATLGFELVVKADDVEDANEVLDAGDG
jgi:hypothetical protein